MTAPPDTLNIGTSVWAVLWSQEEWDQLRVDENGLRSSLMGRSDGQQELIWINPKISTNQKADTLLHEVLHACARRAGADIDGADDSEEACISAITPWLHSALVDNPELMAYLKDPE